MKTKIIFSIFFLSTVLNSYAQDPAIEWQNTIGGSDADIFNSMEPTADGGYILGGYSTSNISGDKTENSNGGIDIWIVKIDDTGSIEWQNTIGGSGDDYVNVVKQTDDGGYIVLAGSDSNISGDKTENSRGGLDFWILKLDADGEIVWQRTYGGNAPDFDTYGQQTADGGYIVGGYSDSGISGDKTEASNGQRDYWVLKLDSNGAIEWQNGIGGSEIDRIQATLQTQDGGYILGGFSTSNISGDKTENSQGGSDYWIVKLNSSGNILWQNTIGGNDADPLRDLIETADGGFLVGGYSKSNISGDKTENSQGDYDYWVVKLDSDGDVAWQNTIGAAGTEFLRDIKQLNDGSYVVAGYSNSNISGDKTENSNGGYDFWLVKLDTSGNLTNQNSIGGTIDDTGGYVWPTSDGGFIIGCSSTSNISGDKTENSMGIEDYWIIKADANILGVTSNDISFIATLFPNPTTNNFTIDLGENYEETTVTISNILGQTITSHKYKSQQIINEKIDGGTGVYFVQILTSEGKRATLKVIKK